MGLCCAAVQTAAGTLCARMTGLSLEIPLVAFSIIMHAIAGHRLEAHVQETGGALFLSEGLVAVFFGSLVGLIVRFSEKEVVELEDELFWYAVLPPILLVQAFKLRSRTFFRQLPFMLIFGVVGTLINFGLLFCTAYVLTRLHWISEAGCTHSFFSIQGDESEQADTCFGDFTPIKAALLAAILSASDGVAALKHIRPEEHRELASLILGENVLNEAISILLFKAAFVDYLTDGRPLDHMTALRALTLLLSAVAIGAAVGLCCCRLFVRASWRRDPIRQVLLIVLSCYLSSGIAEYLGLSGTLTLLICALVISHYGTRNLGKQAKEGSRLTFELCASLAEAFSFIYIGLSLVALSGRYSGRFSVLMFLAVGLWRLVTTLALSLAMQRWTGRCAMPLRDLMALAVAGMVRGNVSWAQALQVRELDHEISSTVLVVVLLSMLVSETVLPFIIRRLQLTTTDHHHHTPSTQAKPGVAGFEDREYLKPLLSPEQSSASSSSSSLLEEEGEEDTGGRGSSWLSRTLRRFDEEVMMPIFGKREGGSHLPLVEEQHNDEGDGGDYGPATWTTEEEEGRGLPDPALRGGAAADVGSVNGGGGVLGLVPRQEGGRGEGARDVDSAKGKEAGEEKEEEGRQAVAAPSSEDSGSGAGAELEEEQTAQGQQA